MLIPSVDYGGSGQLLHFLHANGYPPAAYAPFIERMKTEYHVFGMLLRPLWPEAVLSELHSWNPLSDDLLAFLDGQDISPVIGVGHSIGAIVTLRTALQAPEHFRALVLFDPVLLPPPFIILWNVARWLHLENLVHPPIAGALKRRREFDDLDVVFKAYRRREVFRYLSDESLWAYIAGIPRPRPEGGYELVYSPEWESHIYYVSIWRDLELWRALPRLRVPTMIVRGAETDTFWERTGRLVRRRNPAIRVETVEKSTHLVPLERPNEVFEIMQSFLKESL